MLAPPFPADEDARLRAIEQFRLAEIGQEPAFQQLSSLTADIMETPIALVTIVDSNTQRCAGAAGMDWVDTSRETAFCAYTILGEAPMIVTDATRDARFCNNPAVVGPPFVRFYAGAPLHAGDMRVGSLCVIDTQTRELSAEGVRRLQGLARLAERMIQSRLGEFFRLETEVRLQGFVEAMPVALAVFDAQDTFLLSNTSFRKTFLCNENAHVVAGTDFVALLDRVGVEGPRVRIDGDSGDWKSRWIDLRRRADRWEMEIGSDRWLACQELTMENGETVATFTDVTELKRQTCELQAQSALLRTTLENIDEGIAVFDPAGTLIACSDAYYELLQLPESLRRLGTPMSVLVLDLARRGFLGDGQPDELAVSILALMERKTSGRREVRLPHGRILSISHSVMGDGRTIVSCSDITERREVERLKNEFVSTVSHELRTPLTSIAGSLGLLEGGVGGQLPPQAARLVGIAHKNADRLARLVNDLLDIDKIESGQMEFRRDRLDLNDLTRQAVEQNRPYADRFGATLDFQPAASSIPVIGDLDRLLQVAANLISNAAKYSPPGGTVRLTSAVAGESAFLSVSDEGPGIPEDFRPRLFRRFAQADASDRRAQQGTGLGLSIALAIVERHGGTIEVETETGVGTTFRVKLPLASQGGAAAPERARILVVEDDRNVGTAMRSILECGGMNVDLAGTKTEALHLLESEVYQGLVLDMLLPDGHGLDLIRALRERPEGFDIPIVVVSARADEVRKSPESASLGVQEWLEKPVDLPRLAAAVGRCRGKTGRLSVLYVEDDRDMGQVVTIALSDFANVDLVPDLRTARLRLGAHAYDAAILDLRLPDGSGADLLPDLAAHPEGPVPVIVFSVDDAPGEIASAVAQALTKTRKSIEQLACAVRDVAGRPGTTT